MQDDDYNLEETVNQDDIWFVLINCPDQTAAETIGKNAVTAGLAMMFNISAPIRSGYLWQGELVETNEVQLSFKVKELNRVALFELATQHHPYEVPSIIGWPIEAIDPDYREHIMAS